MVILLVGALFVGLSGEAGATATVGQVVLLLGVLTALVAGAIATRAGHRRPAQTHR